jgi:single-stranded-DNA-specific exonuclease
MQKKWVVKPPGEVELVNKLSHELNINPILSNLLVQRGIFDFESARRFFRPSVSYLHDPFLMKDMDKAVDRLETAISRNERILVYGDYDVDGTTSVALMYSFLKSLYDKVAYYIPDRYREGYGISYQGIDWAEEQGCSLIIALDCGIKSVDKVDYAKEKGIDFLICDHHLPGETLPRAYAVLDPKRKDCSYPFKELSGCGVGFKLVQGFASRNNIPFSSLEQYLDLIAVSIASDIVSITGENRVLTYFGLQWLNNHPRPGIKAILELTNFKKELTVADIVFTIGPRINAAGRIEDARDAVKLLISANEETAYDAGQTVNDRNTERKNLDASITEQALQLITGDHTHSAKKTTVLYNPDWHKGVIGIVASRLTDKYYRPTVILTRSNDSVTGSARSVKDFDIYNAIEACSDLLEQFGGHKYAAGLTLRLENVQAFIDRFENVVASTIEDHMLIQEIEIDAEIGLNDITPSFYKILKQFAPFGPGNMKPVFKTSRVTDKGFSKIVGNNHLKLSVSQMDATETFFDAIGFQLGHYHGNTSRKKPFDICYTIEENVWNGQVSLQLNVKDIRFSEEAESDTE